MLRIKTDLKIKSKLLLRCPRHARYNPEKEGAGGIRGGCAGCASILIAYQARQKLIAAVQEFETKSKVFETVRLRQKKQESVKENPP